MLSVFVVIPIVVVVSVNSSFNDKSRLINFIESIYLPRCSEAETDDNKCPHTPDYNFRLKNCVQKTGSSDKYKSAELCKSTNTDVEVVNSRMPSSFFSHFFSVMIDKYYGRCLTCNDIFRS